MNEPRVDHQTFADGDEIFPLKWTHAITLLALCLSRLRLANRDLLVCRISNVRSPISSFTFSGCSRFRPRPISSACNPIRGVAGRSGQSPRTTENLRRNYIDRSALAGSQVVSQPEFVRAPLVPFAPFHRTTRSRMGQPRGGHGRSTRESSCDSLGKRTERSSKTTAALRSRRATDRGSHPTPLRVNQSGQRKAPSEPRARLGNRCEDKIIACAAGITDDPKIPVNCICACRSIRESSSNCVDCVVVDKRKGLPGAECSSVCNV